jgi:hypothetical protein
MFGQAIAVMQLMGVVLFVLAARNIRKRIS